MRRSENILKMVTQSNVVTITENAIMEGTHKDPKFMALVNITFSQDSGDNVDMLLNDVEGNKEKMLKLKYNLVKMQGEGIELERKDDDILYEKDPTTE